MFITCQALAGLLVLSGGVSDERGERDVSHDVNQHDGRTHRGQLAGRVRLRRRRTHRLAKHRSRRRSACLRRSACYTHISGPIWQYCVMKSNSINTPQCPFLLEIIVP